MKSFFPNNAVDILFPTMTITSGGVYRQTDTYMKKTRLSTSRSTGLRRSATRSLLTRRDV